MSCASDQEGKLDGTPYGFDPTFMSFSSLYNGKLNPATQDGGGYTDAERNSSESRNPIGQFLHTERESCGPAGSFFSSSLLLSSLELSDTKVYEP